MKIADLYLKLGISGAADVSKGLKKISGSLQELFSMSIKTKLTLAGIAAGLTGAAFSAGKTGATLAAFKHTFDLSTDTLQRWQQGAEAFGVSGDEMIGTIGGIQNALADAMTHGGVSEVFTKLAIDPRKFKDAYAVIEELRKRIQSGQVDVMRVFSSGLIDQNVFQMLRQIGDPTKSKLVRPLLTDKDIQAAQRISVSFTRFQENLKRGMDKFVVDNAQSIMKLIQSIQDAIIWFMKFLENNKPLIGDLVEAIKGLTSAILSIAKFFNLIPSNEKAREMKGMSEKEKHEFIKKNPSAVIGGDFNPFVYGGKFVDFLFEKVLGFPKEGVSEKSLKDAGKIIPNTLPKAPDVNQGPGWIEEQRGNTSIFYMNGVDLSGKVSPSWEKETASVYRQIAARGTA